MLNPQLLNHLEAFQEEEEENEGRVTGPASDNDPDESRRHHDHAAASSSVSHGLPSRKANLWDLYAPPSWLLDRSSVNREGYNHLRRLLSSSVVSNVQVGATIVLVGALPILAAIELRTNSALGMDVGRQLHLLWSLLIASYLMWNLLKAHRSQSGDDEPVREVTAARILECRRDLSTLLASVGAPPLLPLPHAEEEIPTNCGGSRLSRVGAEARCSKGQPTSDAPADLDADRLLNLLERFTNQNVALVRRFDDVTDWIRDATALRLLGTSRASSCGVRRCGGLSVERLERSAASRLVRQQFKDAGDDASCTSTHQQSQSHVSRSLDALPLSSLRRNVAVVGLQQRLALFECMSSGCGETDENELDRESNHGQLDPPPVVTLSWLRSLRNDLVHVLYCVVEDTTSELFNRTNQAVVGFGRTLTVTKASCGGEALRRAMVAAEEGLSYLQAYTHVGIIPEAQWSVTTTSTEESEICIDVLKRLSELQHQSDALATALLTLRESLCSSPRGETHRWWSATRDLSSQFVAVVEALGTELQLNHGGDQNSSASTSSTSTDDSTGEGCVDRTKPGCEAEFVLVDTSDDDVTGLDRFDGEGSSDTKLWGSRTLVYSGHGSLIRSMQKSLRPLSEGKNDSAKNRDHVEPSTCYRSLFDELRSRLDMIHTEEVDATASFSAATISDKDEPELIPGEPADHGASPCNAGNEEYAAAVLKELRGVLRDDSQAVDGSGALGDP